MLKDTTMTLLTTLATCLAAMLAAPQTQDIEVLAAGTWTARAHAAEGTWRIVEQENGHRFVELSADFATEDGPELQLLLSPTPMEELTDENADEDVFFIAELERPVGPHRYDLEESVDLGEHESILIFEKAFEMLWCAASLHDDEER